MRSAVVREKASERGSGYERERENRLCTKGRIKKKSKFLLAFHPYHSKFGTVLFIHAKVFNI